MNKCIIPFQQSQTATGNGLPGSNETVVLFNSVTAFGPKSLQGHDSAYWFTYAIAPNANATGNGVNGYFSVDGGITWTLYYQSTTNEPVGDGTTFMDEVFVGMFYDVKFEFVNGASSQTSFKVSMSLDAQTRSSAAI